MKNKLTKLKLQEEKEKLLWEMEVKKQEQILDKYITNYIESKGLSKDVIPYIANYLLDKHTDSNITDNEIFTEMFEDDKLYENLLKFEHNLQFNNKMDKLLK